MEQEVKKFKGKSYDDYQLDIRRYRSNHEEWRDWTKNNGHGFFPIFSHHFRPYLLKLSGNALKLYIYLGTYANSSTGEVKVTVEHMMKFFETTKRTISAWIKELVEAQLIVRVQTAYKHRTHTFMLPYSTEYNEKM